MKKWSRILTLLPAMLAAAIFTAQTKAEQTFTNFAYTRITMDDKDRSYFADSVIPFDIKAFAPPSGPIGVSQVFGGKSVVFTTADKTWATNWHPTPRRQYVVMLAGTVTIEVETGAKRQFSTGDVFLLEDTRGRGHDARVISDEPAVFFMVALPE